MTMQNSKCKNQNSEKIPYYISHIIYSKAGFTLLEALIAMVVLLIGVIGVLQLFPTGLNALRISKNETIAANFVQAQLEEYKAISYDEAISVNRTKISDDPNDPNYKFEKEISVIYVNSDLTESSRDTGLKKITATIYWPEQGQEKNLSAVLLKHK